MTGLAFLILILFGSQHHKTFLLFCRIDYSHYEGYWFVLHQIVMSHDFLSHDFLFFTTHIKYDNLLLYFFDGKNFSYLYNIYGTFTFLRISWPFIVCNLVKERMKKKAKPNTNLLSFFLFVEVIVFKFHIRIKPVFDMRGSLGRSSFELDFGRDRNKSQLSEFLIWRNLGAKL